MSYILSLYHETRRGPHDVGLPDPQSVIIVGHSMGGVVARAMLTMPNYLPNSINTIITMAAPHALPPAPFDWEMQRIYNNVNGYWRKAYAAKWANNNPLWHVTLISIAGGGLDNTVASDYTATSSIVPMTNGFTVYTSTVPGVWTGMDHQAILWCDQFRKVVAKSLLEVVDVRRPAQTKSRAERMQVFQKLYLSGLENINQKTLPYGCNLSWRYFADNSTGYGTYCWGCLASKLETGRAFTDSSTWLRDYFEAADTSSSSTSREISPVAFLVLSPYRSKSHKCFATRC